MSKFYLNTIGGLSLAALVLFFPQGAAAEQLTLAWDRVQDSEVVGYKIFVRRLDQGYDYNRPAWEGSGATCSVDIGGDPGWCGVVARSVNSQGLESANSNEVHYEIIADGNAGGPGSPDATYPGRPDSPDTPYVPGSGDNTGSTAVARAGGDQVADEGTTVLLDAAGSSAAGGFIAAYAWQQLAGPEVTLSDSEDPSPSFVTPSVSGDVDMTFRVTVTDADGHADSDDVTVVIQDNGIRGFDTDVLPFYAANDETMGIRVSPEASLVYLEPLDSADLLAVRAWRPANLLFELLYVDIKVSNPGDEAVVDFHFKEPLPVRAGWYHYDPLGGWKIITNRVSLSEGNTVATLELRDGGTLDIDGIENGAIQYAIGAAIVSPYDRQDYRYSVDDNGRDIYRRALDAAPGSSSGGCFINALD